MAKIKFKPPILSAHGRVGNVIFFNVKGCQYARSHSTPGNPRTEKQQKNRASMAEAVKLWQNLTQAEKAYCNHMARNRPLSGYNIFISMAKRGITLVIIGPERGKIKDRLVTTFYQRADTSVSDITPGETAFFRRFVNEYRGKESPEVLFSAA
jgi:hypothetical protein